MSSSLSYVLLILPPAETLSGYIIALNISGKKEDYIENIALHWMNKKIRAYDFIFVTECYFCEALTEKYLLLLKSPIYFLRLSVPSVYQKYKVTIRIL